MNPIFQWVLLSLTAWRLQRIVTADSWPVSVWFRKGIEKRFGKDSSWVDFFECPFCFGWWSTHAIFAVTSQFIDIPLPVLQSLAASAVVGILGHTFD